MQANSYCSTEWIVPFAGRGCSLGTTQNFLWRSGNLYIMDNHRAAAWCWSRHFHAQHRRSVIHIDAHYDAASSYIPSGPLVLEDLSFEEYRNLYDNRDSAVKLFRWDNYLSVYERLYSSLVDEWIFATHKIGAAPTFSVNEIQPDNLLRQLSQIGVAGRNWIINLDLDFFQSSTGERFPQQQRRPLLSAIHSLSLQAARCVITIALSPECCGSWESAENLCAEVVDVFALDFALPSG